MTDVTTSNFHSANPITLGVNDSNVKSPNTNPHFKKKSSYLELKLTYDKLQY
jgi:hypothetical protein